MIDLENFPDLILAKLADGEKVYALIEELCLELRAAREVAEAAAFVRSFGHREEICSLRHCACGYKELSEALTELDEARRG